MNNKLKVVTIGGGSSYTPELMEGFLKRYDQFPITELWLVDVEEGEEKQNIIFDLLNRMIKKSGYNIKLYKTLDRREALKDADFVTTQFRVGQLKARELDERIPLSHGIIGQETNGAGGLFKGLRTIPVILDIIKDIEELAPKAWMINFTNPAGMVTQAVKNYSNFERFIGVCNVPIGMKMETCKLLGLSEEASSMEIYGLNHLVYVQDIKHDNQSYMNEIITRVTSGENLSGVKNIVSLGFEPEFIKALNLLPCPYHRYYYKNKEMLAIEIGEFYQGETRAEQVMKLEADLFELYKDETLDIKPPQLEQRGGAYYSDAACNVINAIYNDLELECYVNVAHNGHVKNIDPNWTIEITAKIGKNGAILNDNITSFAPATLGLINEIKAFELMAGEAAVTGDYHKALLALNINPLIPSDMDAKIILDELLKAHKKHLPLFNK